MYAHSILRPYYALFNGMVVHSSSMLIIVHAHILSLENESRFHFLMLNRWPSSIQKLHPWLMACPSTRRFQYTILSHGCTQRDLIIIAMQVFQHCIVCLAWIIADDTAITRSNYPLVSVWSTKWLLSRGYGAWSKSLCPLIQRSLNATFWK